jgi:LuxR family maltose regulon positive regulatory protein
MRSLKSSVAMLRGLYGFEGYRVMRDSAALAVELEGDPATPWYALARVAFGFSRYLSGEPGVAEGPLEQAISSEPTIPLVRMLGLSVLSLVAVDTGQLARARELARAALSLGARGGVIETQASALAHLAAGAVHAARGQLAEARSELEHAVEFRETVPGISPWATVEATVSLAQVLLAMGDRSGAAALLDQQRLMTRLERLERQAAGRRIASLDDPLTGREVAVLRQLQSPLSLREIGQELHLSANTIKTHVQAIYRKLGVSTRHDAVEQGRETGIL